MMRKYEFLMSIHWKV